MPLPAGREHNYLTFGMRYGIRTRISRFLALRHDALTFRLNAHKFDPEYTALSIGALS